MIKNDHKQQTHLNECSGLNNDDLFVEEIWIESDGNGIQNQNTDDSDHEVEIGSLDIFADPDPFEEFSQTFSIRNETSKDRSIKSGTTEDKKYYPDQVHIHLFGVKAENGQTLNSTGLTLWRASSLLCEYLASNPGIARNKTVLELGAGLGLCGILAYKIGAKQCVLTDGDTDTLKELRRNVDHNLQHVGASSSLLPCHQLRWGRNVSNFRKRYEGLFDVIMGSDIIYVEEILDPLFETVQELLSTRKQSSSTSVKNSEPKFLLSYARRNVNIDLVFDCAHKHGFSVLKPDNSEGVFVFTRESVPTYTTNEDGRSQR